MKNCEQCGVEFSGRKKQRFCSHSCSNKAKNTGITRSEEYKKKMSALNSGTGNPFYGRKHSRETKEKMSRSRKGKFSQEKHPNWKGGLKKRKDGYIRISVDDAYLHRRIMENHLGRKLKDTEHVHHIDGDASNNTLENLELLDRCVHSSLHARNRKRDNFGRFICKE